MTHDDVIRMARASGLFVGTNMAGVGLVGHSYQPGSVLTHLTVEDMQRFAALVAQAEREACAKLVWQTEESGDEYVSLRETIADAIRARGEK